MANSDSSINETTKILTSPPLDQEEAGGEHRMPVCIVLNGHEIGRSYCIDRPRVCIGRDPDRADMAILGDESISRKHAWLKLEGTDVYIEDAGSANGTRVGGFPLTAVRRLVDGDKIALGGTILKFTYHDGLESTFHQHLQDMLNIDELTGLPVQRVFRTQLESALVSAQRAGYELTFLMMDMDGLKQINDTHGHKIGAGTIAEVGRILGRIVEARGQVTRFGGDEFSAFLAPCPRVEGRSVAEKIRSTIQGHPFKIHGIDVRPTMSIGLSSMPQDGTSVGVLFVRADEALYRAKRTGRNRVSD